MSLITQAPPAAELKVLDTDPHLFIKRDEDDTPCVLSVSGSSNFDLHPFNVVATGTVKPVQPGSITITLYAAASVPDEPLDPAGWLPIAASEPEPVGGVDDPEETMWMMKGADLMYSLESGKLQGTYTTNVAGHPVPLADLEERLRDIEADKDPAIVFAIGVTFDTAVPIPEGEEKDEVEGNEVTLALFALSD